MSMGAIALVGGGVDRDLAILNLSAYLYESGKAYSPSLGD